MAPSVIPCLFFQFRMKHDSCRWSHVLPEVIHLLVHSKAWVDLMGAYIMRGVTGSSGLVRSQVFNPPKLSSAATSTPRCCTPPFSDPSDPRQSTPDLALHNKTLIDAVDEKEGNSCCFLGPLIRGVHQHKIKYKCLFDMEIWLIKEVQEKPTEEYLTHGSHSMSVNTSFHQQRLL